MPWPKTGGTHHHAQLGFPDKGRAIKELVVCRVLLELIPRVSGRERRDLAPLSLMDLMLECLGQQSRPHKKLIGNPPHQKIGKDYHFLSR